MTSLKLARGRLIQLRPWFVPLTKLVINFQNRNLAQRQNALIFSFYFSFVGSFQAPIQEPNYFKRSFIPRRAPNEWKNKRNSTCSKINMLIPVLIEFASSEEGTHTMKMHGILYQILTPLDNFF